jgi:uncharacterized membrane-anchored protein
MCAFSKSYIGKGVSRFLVPVVLVNFLLQVSQADQLSLVPSQISLAPLTPGDQGVGWILGPAKTRLGDGAEISIPEDYRFVGASGARMLLQHMGNPVPDGMAGLLAPNSGKWWVVLQFSGVGYLKNLEKLSAVDSAQVLKGVRERIGDQNTMRIQQGMPPITSVDWAIQPAFDTGHNTLEWAFRADSAPGPVINHTVRMFGRRGFWDVTAVQPDQPSAEKIPLTDMMKGISFNTGERYQDYQPGDKIAKIKLENLIAGEPDKQEVSALMKGAIWAGVVLIAASIAGVVVVLRRKLRIQKSALDRDCPTGRDPGLVALFHNGNGSHNRNGARRKRAFNYQKYYADMMLQVSSGPSLLTGVSGTNGKRVAHETNGWHPPQTQEPTANQIILRANLELIANQTNLIEEQKRLLQEQSKLIEEKSRLIREKNQLLEKQAELFERDLL